ncbi:hypothetical protein EV197_1805 [Aquimarina brevivitae]|uniref:Uncharacterized protein n=1 Tax=Aquimarina brevivitae TaxID=323412 RepID=A0A4Q7P1I1_9FLAO|nr:hypothetical protein EV197_1805 [Aquimarina brevivitae]
MGETKIVDLFLIKIKLFFALFSTETLYNQV